MGTLAIVGTLVGVLVGFAGNFLIQRQLRTWQREQWILDAKKAEWRELIGALCQSKNRVELHISMTSDGEGITVKEGEASRIVDEADAEAKRTIEDRIFIAEKVKNAKILSDWLPEREILRLIIQDNNFIWKLLAIRAGYIRLGLLCKY